MTVEPHDPTEEGGEAPCFAHLLDDEPETESPEAEGPILSDRP